MLVLFVGFYNLKLINYTWECVFFSERFLETFSISYSERFQPFLWECFLEISVYFFMQFIWKFYLWIGHFSRRSIDFFPATPFPLTEIPWIFFSVISMKVLAIIPSKTLFVMPRKFLWYFFWYFFCKLLVFILMV